MSDAIKIATRKSPLALKQTAMVQEWLGKTLPEDQFEELPLSTQVDERLSWSLEQRGGLGLFTKELEDALLENQATLAVHSAKDLPTTFQADLVIAGYLPRARANDVLVKHADVSQPETIASSSPRRRAQIELGLTDVTWTTIRGNVETRLRKIVQGEADATILAAAGLDRLGITSYEDLEFRTLPLEEVVPAAGQAAIAIQCRRSELDKYENLFCEKTKLAVSFERAFLHRLGGGCQTPVGAHYAESVFYIYHPKVGHMTFTFSLESLEEIDSHLDRIFEETDLANTE
ncbi:MAG: hydroxymethylbilane synthase [Verrucomicrobiota bacterium]